MPNCRYMESNNIFSAQINFQKLHKPAFDSHGEDNGQVTVIGGSTLFHGAPILSLKAASRMVDMVFFASPHNAIGRISEQIKSKLMSFIWIPWDEIDEYINKSDAILIGPGMMRYSKEGSKLKNYDKEGKKTREITERLLKKFPEKKWVIDAGSLQVMDADWIPENSVITPNKKEFETLFGIKIQDSRYKIQELERIASSEAKKYHCVITLKGPETIVASPTKSVIVKGGNPGLTKGGSGDVLAGLTVALLAKNDPLLAASCASYIEKASADDLFNRVGTNYNMDDLADNIPATVKDLLK